MSLGQSVLSSGNWYKLGCVENGIYKITPEYISEIGLGSSINPHHLQVYGNATGMLPQPNYEPRPIDLIENALYFEGDADDIFEQNEYFLFYTHGPNRTEWTGDEWVYNHNIYSDTSYYFVRLGATNGKRMTSRHVDVPNPTIVNEFLDLVTYEKNDYNLLHYVNSGGSGREWYGDLLIPSTGLVKNFTFETPDLIDSLALAIDVHGFSESQTMYDLLINGNELGRIQIGSSVVSTYAIKGKVTRKTFSTAASGDEQVLTVDFVRNNGSIFGFINQLLATYNRRLIFRDMPLFFNNLGTRSNTYQIQIQSSSPLITWDITDPTSTEIISDPIVANGIQSFIDTASVFKKYVAFSGTEFPTLISFGKVANQNIRALSPSDGLIITAPEFLAEAQQLAQLHQDYDQLNIAVVTTRQIYNEFSSGMQDVTAIRDAIRHYYLKNQDFRYALLFGDCSYDYKDRVDNNTNFVPIYESFNSWDPVLSYSSDDYYGFMESMEGEWRESSTGDHTMEVGIGRIPVKSVAEAKSMVKKIARYLDNCSEIGNWKNVMTYVADDGNAGYFDTHTHMQNAEDFTSFLSEYAPQAQYDKLYIDKFPQIVSGPVESSPEAREALRKQLEEGTFMVNFIGHGSERKWTEETILDIPFIEEMSNADRLPIFLTATCEFGRYDDPTMIDSNSESGAEKLLLKEEGGAIALLTTTRPVYSFTNEPVNLAFHYYLLRGLEDGPEMGQKPRLGDLTRLTKNNSLSGPINRNFSLLGDPFLRLDYPDHEVIIDAINGVSMANSIDTLKALEPVHIEASIRDATGNVLSGFQGEAEFTIYDQRTELLTLGQRDTPFPYKVRQNILFQGKSSVRAGLFTIDFIMPKNISYDYGNGSISIYAYNSERNTDATGGTNNIRLGGSFSTPTIEANAPDVALYISTPGFRSGGIVTRSDTLVAEIFDESGINMTGLGLDRDITLEINDMTFMVNNLYVAEKDSYQNGKILFPLSDITAGRYTATISIYDLHNNQTVTTVDFIVSDQPTIPLASVTAYPNPASNYFSLQFDHPRQGETLDVAVELLSIHGGVVLRKEFVRSNSSPREGEFEISIDPNTIQNGVYFCRLKVISRLDGAAGQATRKMIIIN